MKIAAVADIHASLGARENIREELSRIREEADALVLAGDLTNFGRPDELQPLLSLLEPIGVPVLTVFGNHDYESGQQRELKAILQRADVHVLDGEVCQLGEVGFAGVKGFLGGFGRWMLAGFGEPEVKAFVKASIDETERLEHALAGVSGERIVVVLHYSPIVQTLVGENPEIYPYLGTSRLEDAIDHHGVDLVIHGHAHRGSPDGQTRGGVPVRNVSLGLVMQTEGRPFRILEV